MFAEYVPALQPVLASPFVRGAVSGVGAITALAGLAELGGLLRWRRPPETTDGQPGHEPAP